LFCRKEIEYEKLPKAVPGSEEEMQINDRLAQLEKGINALR